MPFISKLVIEVNIIWCRLAGTDIVREVLSFASSTQIPSIFLYHRLDLLEDMDVNTGRKFDEPKYSDLWVTYDHATVKLAPKAFCNAADYLLYNDDPSTVEELHGLLNGDPRYENLGCSEPGCTLAPF